MFKLRRIYTRVYQPQNPLFWLMLALNALSFGLAWIVQNRALNTLGMLVVGGFALANAAIGTWLLWRLLASTPKNDLPKDPPTS